MRVSSERPGSDLEPPSSSTHPIGALTASIERRRRRLDALQKISQARATEHQDFALFFKTSASPVFAYYACINVLDLPDIIDAQSEEVDFLLSRYDIHTKILLAAGLLASGSWLGPVAKRDAVAHLREHYGDLAAWALTRPSNPKLDSQSAFPDREVAYAAGHAGYRVFAARQQAGFSQWVNAICTKPTGTALVNPTTALYGYLKAREQLQIWEAHHADHQA